MKKKNDLLWPKISIVTPSFNQAKYLERTLQSVLSQGYPNLEYIVIDGGSTDGSVDIIRKYAHQLNYWVSEPDTGQADAIRKGFSLATGEILAWLNSDDTYEPKALETVAESFRKNPAADVIYGYYWWIDENDKKIHEIRFPAFNFENLVYVSGCLHQTATFWKKDLYQRVGGIDKKYSFCMDHDLFCRFGEKGTFVGIPRYLANFRIHKSAKSSVIMNIGKQEFHEIRSRYVEEDQHPLVTKMLEIKSELRRAKSFIALGEWQYLLRRGLSRLKKKT